MPLVSVIIPCFHADGYITRAVQSVLAQTFTDWEAVIVSDDGKDYCSILTVQGIGDDRLRFYSTHAIGTGASHARNIGLDHASGDIIAPLDADDMFYPEKLAAMVPYAIRYSVVSCGLRHVEYDENNVMRDGYRMPLQVNDRLLTAKEYFSVNYSMNTMHVFDRNLCKARWPEHYPVMNDAVFAMHCFNDVSAVYHVAAPLHIYVKRSDSLCHAVGAPLRYIEAKKRILAGLRDGTLGIHVPETSQAFEAFMVTSLTCEEEYKSCLDRGEHVAFSDLLARRLSL
jgi:succinoglycan biosynthesis protein ExoO